jgi:general secretion pathway protein A
MYQQFYGFKEAPFNLTPDSKFLFLSHRHQEALAALLFGVQERKGFICMTGEIGCGKTTLCRAMLNQLDADNSRICMVLNSYLTDLELLKTINEEFGLAAESDSKKKLIDELNKYLVQQFAEGNNVVLIIDESQNLRPEALEQIRMISNLETETAKLIQIIMIGQPELRRTLALPELEQLNQRITVRHHLTPLSENEIHEYIRHRLVVAEPQVEVNFTNKACSLVYHYTRGVPRRINVLCDRCLLMGYTQGTYDIDERIVQKAAEEVRGEIRGAGPVSTVGDGMGAPSGGIKKLLGYTLVGGLGMLFIAGAIALGMFMNDYLERSGSTANNTTPAPAATPEVAPTATAEPTATPTPEVTAPPAPTATPTPVPTPTLYDNWKRDSENLLRVRDGQLAEAASYITLVGLWQAGEVDLSLFEQSAPDEVASFDMLAMMKQLNFESVVSEDLSEALKLDLPIVARLAKGKELTPFVVISSMRGEMLEVLDPMHGKRMVQRSELEPSIVQTVTLYQDAEKLTGMRMNEQSGRVKILQTLLVSEKDLSSTPDGKFGSSTREALQKFQRDAGLEATGEVDPRTAAYIASRLNPRRPRLYS